MVVLFDITVYSVWEHGLDKFEEEAVMELTSNNELLDDEGRNAVDSHNGTC
jgi:hypothetical protein